MEITHLHLLSRKPQTGFHGAIPFGEGWRWSLGLNWEAAQEAEATLRSESEAVHPSQESLCDVRSTSALS